MINDVKKKRYKQTSRSVQYRNWRRMSERSAKCMGKTELWMKRSVVWESSARRWGFRRERQKHYKEKCNEPYKNHNGNHC